MDDRKSIQNNQKADHQRNEIAGTSSPKNERQRKYIPTTTPHRKDQNVRPSLSKDVADEIRQSFVIRKSKKLRERKKLITRVIERRESKRSFECSNHNQKTEKKSTKLNQSEADVNNQKNQYENTTYNINNDPTIQESSSTAKVKVEYTKRESLSDNNMNLHETLKGRGNLIDNQMLGDKYSYKKEFSRLTGEYKTLKTKLVTRDAKISLLDQQVSDLTVETKNLRKQLSRWQSKANKLSKLQSKDRMKFDRSTDLIAEARIGLTKALNSSSKFQAKIHDLESIVNERDRRLDNLFETIERQSDTIREMNIKMRDKDTVVQLNENEKRKLEDEVAVLISSRDGGDIGTTLRRLEQERQTWSWEQVENLKAVRIELEDENERMLEREKSRYKQEFEIMTEDRNKKKAIDINDQNMQGYINQQLDDMKEANRTLQEKHTEDRENLRRESLKQDDTIIELENHVHNLQKMIASQDQSTKELVFRKAEIEFVKNDLQDARRQNEFLEDKISKLNKRATDFCMHAHKSHDEASFGRKARKVSSKSLDQFLFFREEKYKHKKKNGKVSKFKIAKKTKKKHTIDKRKKRKDRKKPKKRCKSKKSKIKSPSSINESSSMLALKPLRRHVEYSGSRKRGKKSKKKRKTAQKLTLNPSTDIESSSSMIVFKHKHRHKKHTSISSIDGEQGRSKLPRSILCTKLQ